MLTFFTGLCFSKNEVPSGRLQGRPKEYDDQTVNLNCASHEGLEVPLFKRVFAAAKKVSTSEELSVTGEPPFPAPFPACSAARGRILLFL